jgi:hypothetical protein
MRITRDLLLSTARDTIKRQTYGGHDLVCVYLTGSLIYDQPLLGGITDIDMVYVHSGDSPCKREIVPITEEIHLDIAHFPQSAFSQPRSLRTDPWIGSFLCQDPLVLYDSQHWFEYTQAGTAAQFYQPVNVIQRVKHFSEQARSSWLSLQTAQGDFVQSALPAYLKILKNEANAIACLTSVPLTDRRFLVDFPFRAQALQMPGLVGGFTDLILPEEPIEPDWDTWIANWKASYDLLLKQPEVPNGLSDGRLTYYEKAILELSTARQEAALWVMLWTWSWISSLLPSGCSENTAFKNFCSTLSLSEDLFTIRLASLDTYLDTVEEAIDKWSYMNGL